MSDCSIKFEDNNLSRYHCTITFNQHWILNDGDGKKFSTNGTWLFAEDFFEIYHGMNFKVGETLFEARLK
jgi:pSer/pThr/pTyr-binding forkhead associated (FHA) protein